MFHTPKSWVLIGLGLQFLGPTMTKKVLEMVALGRPRKPPMPKSTIVLWCYRK